MFIIRKYQPLTYELKQNDDFRQLVSDGYIDAFKQGDKVMYDALAYKFIKKPFVNNIHNEYKTNHKATFKALIGLLQDDIEIILITHNEDDLFDLIKRNTTVAEYKQTKRVYDDYLIERFNVMTDKIIKVFLCPKNMR